MSIKIITGDPGAGKSLMTIKEAYEWLRKDNVFEYTNPETGEVTEVRKQVFACNFNELSEEKTGFKIWKDPYDWQSLPPGSLLVVDEAADFDLFLPQKPHETKPKCVDLLRKHRHQGINIWFIVQNPISMLHKYIRDLADEHWHYHRSNKGEKGYLYINNKVFDPNRRQQALNEGAVSYGYKFDKKFFGTYKSSALHIMKEEKPRVFYYLLMAAPATALLAFLGYWQITAPIREADEKKEIEKEDPSVVEMLTADELIAGQKPSKLTEYREDFRSNLEKNGKNKDILTTEEYASLFEPRFATRPETAPIFDDFTTNPKTFPRLSGCSVNFRDPSSCRCYTQQGTIYPVKIDRCLLIVNGNRPFNIYQNEASSRTSGASFKEGKNR